MRLNEIVLLGPKMGQDDRYILKTVPSSLFLSNITIDRQYIRWLAEFNR